MNNERPLEVNLPQPFQIMVVIKQPLTGRDVSVVADVLGMSENDVWTEQGKRFVEDVVHAEDLALVKQVGRIDHDFQARRARLC